jgi:hypothetical protein
MFRLVRKLVANRWSTADIYNLLSLAPQHRVATALLRAGC